jgi:NADPH-dependent glutamate synthase beta subunit-like oxidoreductase
LFCDLLVPAIGQVTWVEDEAFGAHRKASFEVGKAFETSVAGVFAAGDAVFGPATVVQSVAHGNQVALTVDAWLATGELRPVYHRPKRHDVAQLFNLEEYASAQRAAPPAVDPHERRRREGFEEVEGVFEAPAAQEECKRCLRCDLEWLERVGEPLP